MKRFGSQLKKQAHGIKLSASERRDLRERLTSYLEYHPLPETKAKETAAKYLESEAYKTVSFEFLKTHIKAISGSLALLFLIVIPVVAERTVPGDVLYPIKVQINEEVRSTLTRSPYEKVEWEAERLSRRIAEARLLASEGKLTPEFENEVAEAVRAHSDAAQEEIEELRATDAEEAAIAEIVFATALEVQSVVLKAESDHASSTNQESSKVIAAAVEERRQAADDKQIESGAVPSLPRLQARIEIETTRAYELLESVRSIATTEEVTDIERRMADIERKLAPVFAGEIEDEVVARETLSAALQRIKKLLVFMTDIDVRATVIVEELVPVELTPDEYRAEINNHLSQVDILVPLILTALSSSTEIGSVDKVEVGLLEIEELRAKASTTEEADLPAALEAAKAAHELVRDIQKLFGIEIPRRPVVEEEPEVIEKPTAESVGSSTPVIEETATSTEEVVEEPEETTEEPEIIEENASTSPEAVEEDGVIEEEEL